MKEYKVGETVWIKAEIREFCYYNKNHVRVSITPTRCIYLDQSDLHPAPGQDELNHDNVSKHLEPTPQKIDVPEEIKDIGQLNVQDYNQIIRVLRQLAERSEK